MKFTGPLPVPATAFSVIQLVAVLAVQEQVLALAVIVTDEAPPSPTADTVVGDSV